MAVCILNQILGIESVPDLSPITVECASMIEAMSLSEKQWILLTIDGIKTGYSEFIKLNTVKNGFS